MFFPITITITIYREIQGNIDEVEQVIKKIEKEKKENGGAGDKLSSLMKSLMTGF